MRAESRKIWWKQYGIWIVLFAAILKVIVLWFQGGSLYTEALIRRENEIYTAYMEQVGGKLTEEKIEWLENEKERIEKNKTKMESLWDDYNKKKISFRQYADSLGKASEDQRTQTVFQLVYQDMQREKDKEEGYLLNPNGWITLLGQENLDWILIVLAIVLISPVFSIEYETEMNCILKTSRYGRTKLFIEKIFAVIITGIFVTIIDCGIELLVEQWRVGLSCWKAPIQSIRIFQNSPYNITLIETFFLEFLIKLYGWIYLSSLLIFLSIICKNTVPVLFIGSMITLIPYFLLEKVQLYQLPFPTAFFMPSGFLAGIDQEQQYFVTIEQKTSIILMLVTLLIMLTLILLAHNWYKKEVWGKKKWFIIILAGTIFIVGFSFYNYQKLKWLSDGSETTIYDSLVRGTIEENEEWKFELIEGRIQVEQKKISEKKYWLDELLMESGWEVSWMQLLNNHLYYLEGKIQDEDRIIQLNLESFQAEVVYTQRNKRWDNPYFLNINSSNSLIGEVYWNLEQFIIRDQTLILTAMSELYYTKGSKEEKHRIDDLGSGHLAADNAYIYYINGSMRLCSYSIQDNMVNRLMEEPCLDFKLENNSIYYQLEDEKWYPLNNQ